MGCALATTPLCIIMKPTTILYIAFFLVSCGPSAVPDLYSELSTISIVKDNYEIVKTHTGIDINSKETFENSKGITEPITHLMLEGPLKYTHITDLQQGISATANVVKQEVDSTYENEQELYPGLGVDLLDFNGIQVGILNYKMSREPDTYVRRAIIYSEKGLYTYTIILHQSEPKSRVGMLLDALIIVSVNSGQL
jgi:hypothetical protein